MTLFTIACSIFKSCSKFTEPCKFHCKLDQKYYKKPFPKKRAEEKKRVKIQREPNVSIMGHVCTEGK